IISIYLGEQLEDVVAQLIETGEAKSSKQGGRLMTGVNTLPDFRKDATDRNRTSPFAFTGNKFEFRMVASALSVAEPNTALNTIVADTLSDMADELEKASDFDLAVHDLIKRTLSEHQRIIFNGNGYSEEWVEEAKRRGLPNVKTMVDAIPFLTQEQTVKIYERQHVLSRTELESRAEIHYEAYSKAINIEAKTMMDMASKKYIPSVIRYTTELAKSINEIRNACAEADISVQISLLREISSLLGETKKAYENLKKVNAHAGEIENEKLQAEYFKDVVFKAMGELRAPVDILETVVDKNFWPVPAYGDMLFEV
ncbi:MAG: glutamine synthetase type III, partial [Acetivibrio sp.]